ncbi:protein of unknown function [Methylorubrum extorquens DM4]|uniref:Uncharacterized protein n=1 Tax=Methylorubrum extorquens (strain DSM 6343 / CIP 106787 / DM4) TaxID=661410 RepID=C7C841_METED|nr:protein of unknown function [Methylorubrum extorquens DM4]
MSGAALDSPCLSLELRHVPDPVVLVVAASFTAGCAPVHALRRHADAVTLALGLLAYGLVTAIESLLAARFALIMVPDRASGWMYGTAGGG